MEDLVPVVYMVSFLTATVLGWKLYDILNGRKQ